MISKFRPEAEFPTDERCSIAEIQNRAEDAGCSIVRAWVAPEVTTQLHALRGVDERYVMLAGEGRVEVGDVGAADLIFLCVSARRAFAAPRTSTDGVSAEL